MNKRIFFSGGFLIGSLLIQFAANATTLKESVIVALETNPTISADEAAARASESDIDVARSGYFPTVNVFGTTGRQYTRIKNQLSPLSFPLDGKATRNITNPVLSLRQNIFDGMATPFAVARARELEKQALSTLGLTREQIAFNAVSAHVNLYSQQRLLKLDEENIKKHEEILAKVQKRVEGGISTIADVDQVKSRLEQARVLKERTVGLLEVALADYIAVTDFHPEVLRTPTFPRDLFSKSLDSILSRVYSNNPSVMVAMAQLKVSEAEFDQTLSPFLPSVRVELNSNSPLRNSGGVNGVTNTYTAQVVGEYNIFSGGRSLAQRNSQRERVVQSKKLLDSSRRNAERVSRSAWGRLLSADQQIEELDIAVDVNTRLQREYELQFALVSRPLLDLLDAYVSYYRAKSDLIAQEADEITNYALLLASMGDLVCYFQREASDQGSEAKSEVEIKQN